MTITSLSYLFAIGIGATIYYIIPKGWQWIELLALSILIYCMMGSPLTILYLIGATILAYLSTNISVKLRNKEEYKKSLVIISIAIIIFVFVWFLVRGSSLIVFCNGIIHFYIPSFPIYEELNFLGPLGMGYYTFQLIGYVLDCYWGIIPPQKNIIKLFLFTIFFPQLTTGPISKYSQLKQLYEQHYFKYDNLCFGAQRILWGFFKELVIAEKVGVIVNGIWNSLDVYTGYYRWIAFLLYPLQLYTNFSGGMDIVLGSAEIFGIRLPENFNNPFFSCSSQEFWQRWHITLGAWAKDYVLYPILKSKWMVNFSKFSKKKFGKKYGKIISTSIGMLFLWIVMGIWHGATKYIVGVGLWYWLVMTLADLFKPFLKKLTDIFKIKTESFSWKFFQRIRTYLIFAVGIVFFRAPGIRMAISFLKSLVGMFIHGYVNPWIFFDQSILQLGISFVDINIIILGTFLLIVVAKLRDSYGYARKWIANQGVIFRWAIWIGIFILILVYGNYGPGYSASEFIYRGF